MTTYAYGYFNYQVPRGRVAVMRGFKYTLNTTFSGMVDSDVTASIYTGAPVADNGTVIVQRGIVTPEVENLRLGQFVDELIPVYVVAGEFQYISLIITFSATYIAAVDELNPVDFPGCDVKFYGQSLETTGRSINFEPGTVEK